VSSSAIRAGAAYIELSLRDGVSRPLHAASVALRDFGNRVAWQGARIAAMGAAVSAPLAAMAHSFARSALESGRFANRRDASNVQAYVSAVTALSNAMAAFRDAVGSAVLPLMSRWPNALARIVNQATAWVRANRALVQGIARFASMVVVAGTGLIVIGKALATAGSVFGVLATVASVAATAMAALGSVLAAILSPIGLVITGVVALGAYLLWSSGVGQQALEWLAGAFGDLKADALDAWQGIADALATGDIAAAAKILWLALEMEWLKGVHAVTKIWLGVKGSMLRTWNDVVFGIARGWNDVWATVESGLVDAVSFMGSVLDGFYVRFRKGWGSITDEIAKGLLYVQGQLDPTLDVAQAQNNVDEDRRRINQGLDKGLEQRGKEREAWRQNRQAGIERARVGANDGLAQAQADREAEMQREFDKKLAGTQSRANDAKKAFDDARGAARQKRKDWEARGGDGGGPVDVPMLVAPMATEKAKLESKGSFNAMAVRGLGSSSLADRTAKATEKSADLLKKVEENTKAAGARFL
jgi:hypothetical protein